MSPSYIPRFVASAIVLPLVCGFAASAWGTIQQDEPVTMDRFHRWMEQHGKSYPTVDEKLRRFEVYRRNVEDIEATNRQGELSYTLGENQFTDLTSEEFLATYTGRFVLPPDMASHEEDDAETVITTRAGDVVEGHAMAMHGGNLSAVPEGLDFGEKRAPSHPSGTKEHAVSMNTTIRLRAWGLEGRTYVQVQVAVTEGARAEGGEIRGRACRRGKTDGQVQVRARMQEAKLHRSFASWK
jgi:hypothetical protein